MNFKPLGERVLVERTEVENKTASGIIIPDNAKKNLKLLKLLRLEAKLKM